MKNFPFAFADVEANFSKADLERGRDCWQKGLVRDLEVLKGGHSLKALVQGTAKEPYSVVVNITQSLTRRTGKKPHFRIQGVCTCPVSADCKHAVAVCLDALASRKLTLTGMSGVARQPIAPDNMMGGEQRSRSFPATPPSDLHKKSQETPKKGDLWDTWLDDLAKSEGGSENDDRSREQIFYVVSIIENRWNTPPRYILIKPIVSRYLKSGGSASPRELTPPQLSESQAKYVTSEDRLIGKLMQDSSRGNVLEFCSPPGDPEVFDLIMRRVIATGRCYYASVKDRPLSLGDTKPAKLGWHVEHDGSQFPAIIVGDDPTSIFALPSSHPWYVDLTTRQSGPLSFQTSLMLAHKFLAGPKLLLGNVATVAKKIATRSLSGGVMPPVAVKIDNRKLVEPVPCLRLTTYVAETGHVLNGDERDRVHHLALLCFSYDGVIVDPSTPDILRKQKDNRLIVMSRKRQVEVRLAKKLTEDHGFATSYLRPYDIPKDRLSFSFTKTGQERMQWLDFLHHEVPELRAEGWRVDVDADFANQFKTVEADGSVWEGDLKENEGSAWWFSLDLGIIVEGQRVALLPLLVQALKRIREPTTAEIEGLALSGKLYVDLPDGRALALPFERVKDILSTLVELYDQPLNPNGSMTVSLDLAAALSRINEATQMRWLGGKKLKHLIERMRAFKGLADVPPPPELQATLRPYQRDGLNWLQFLRDYGLGGILADDMGLGKTVQALAHLLVEKAAKRIKTPCLIVCPTSLVPNWQDEAQKFAPTLKVLSLHGKDRAERFGEIKKADIVLTTYALLLRDKEELLPREWYIVILDEAQAIKNPTAQVTQLACELKAQHRLCLTGTPVENHLGEAWSHFSFLMPGMLGGHKDFTKRFRLPIEKHKDSERQGLLAQRLKPFILRRNKSEVAKELPPKTEIIHHVEFDSSQRDLYETLRLTMHEKVQEAVSEKGFSRSRIVILDALLKLRQVCCDPRLVKLDGGKKSRHSAKLDSLMEMLPQMIEEGRRILLFSQFTSMLDLIKEELDKEEIAYVEIRGDTVDRKTPVTQFQKGEIPLFLISLKAGGTGLNLTAADTVIHYDPWWNPAVENQATDRAHRIGQDKPVFVYKFIVKGTVEDRILDLQSRKRNLASSLMDERPDATAAFEVADLEFLFQDVG